MKRTLIAAILSWGLMAAPAQALELKPYSGVGIGAFGLNASALGVTIDSVVTGAYAKFGVDINDYIGVELRAGRTSTGTNNTTNIFGVIVPLTSKLSTSYFFSYFAKLQMPERDGWKDGWRTYVLIGATTAKGKIVFSTLGLAAATDATRTGLSYGGGVEYKFHDNMSAGVELVSYWNKVGVSSITDISIYGGTTTFNYAF